VTQPSLEEAKPTNLPAARDLRNQLLEQNRAALRDGIRNLQEGRFGGDD